VVLMSDRTRQAKRHRGKSDSRLAENCDCRPQRARLGLGKRIKRLLGSVRS